MKIKPKFICLLATSFCSVLSFNWAFSIRQPQGSQPSISCSDKTTCISNNRLLLLYFSMLILSVNSSRSGVGELWSAKTASVISTEPDLCHYNQSDPHFLFLYNTYDHNLVREHNNLINPAMVKSSLYNIYIKKK